MARPRIRRRAARAANRPRALVVGAAVLALALARVPAGAADERFVHAVADLPLPPGLVEVEGTGVVFDKPGGRIVEAYARGAVDRYTVTRFYHGTLPQLGWRRLDRLVFEREGEVLRIRFGGTDGDLTVRFSISPE